MAEPAEQDAALSADQSRHLAATVATPPAGSIAACVEALEAENKRLRSQVESLQRDLTAVQANSTNTELLRLKKENKELERRVKLEHESRSVNYAALQRALAQRKDDKKEIEQWQAFYELVKQRKQHLKQRHNEYYALLDSFDDHQPSPADDLPTGLQISAPAVYSTEDLSTDARIIQSSQSTEAEDEFVHANENLLENVEEAGSDPVVISVRHIKRQRSVRDAPPTVLIKQESGSSPVLSSRLAGHFPVENVDLDEDTSHIVTPRKRRRLAMASITRRMDQSQEDQCLQGRSQWRSTSLPLELTTSNADRADQKANTNLPHPKMLQASKSQLKIESESPDISALDSQPELRNLTHGSSIIKPGVKQGRTTRGLPLQDTSTNRQVSPRTSSKKSKSLKHCSDGFDKLSSKHCAPPISPYLPSPAPSDKTSNSAGPKPTNLLDTLLATKQRLAPRTSAITSAFASFPPPSTPAANVPPKPNGQAYTKSRAEGQNEPLPPGVKAQSLRTTPLAQQTINNFKINPKSNNGTSYAYDEVVRNRAQRRCMPGCTRPECCGGQFRKMAELGGLPSPTGNLWDSSQDGKTPDQRLIENYLGDSDPARLASMTDTEKYELLLDAQAWTLANQHGRHRAYYPRSRTPPGYWRTGMPTTQEAQTDRAEAQKRERERIEERYHEALKPNGRWMFRDE